MGVYRVISADDVKALIDGDEPYTLVDVRTESEFIAGHIPTAVSIPGDSLSAYAPSAFPDKDELIIVYCLSGGRSANAAQLLISLGYTNVYDLGGIMMWPYEIVLD
ncbi:MAG: rhodanese-like domain-containing protein [Coriobacteriia bacterium]|nr:rhodanese-like domain-containing protein [Coriobacteriia bacterium]